MHTYISVYTHVHTQLQCAGEWREARSAFIVHNMVYQGRFPCDPEAEKRLGVLPEILSLMKVNQPLKVGKQKVATKGLKGTEPIANPSIPVLNFMLGAIKTADLVLTVSPGYAREVSSDGGKGAEMENALRQVGIQGILNGVEDVVRPDNAVLGLAETYDADSLDKKKQVKAAMQVFACVRMCDMTPSYVA